MTGMWENNMEGLDSENMRWSPVILVSVLFHAALFSLLLLVPESFSIRRPTLPGPVYEVQLVEMPASPGPGKQTAPVKQETSAPAPKTAETAVPVPAQKPAKRIAEVKREKKPLIVAKKTLEKEVQKPKKRETSPSELIDRAISKIDRKVRSEKPPRPTPPPPPPKDRKSHLDRALADIQSKVRERPGSGDGRSGGGGFLGTVMQLYQAKVTEWIKSNWSYPAALQPEGNPEATVLLEVRRDGTIVSIRFANRSSDEIFDRSVLRAVERSNPLPQFPESYTRSHEEFEIRFNLDRLQQG